MADVDETQCLQDHERLADGGAAHLQLVREVPLGWELVPRRHARFAHELAQTLTNVLVQAAAALEGPERGGGGRAHCSLGASLSGPTGLVVQPLTGRDACTNLGRSRLSFATAREGRVMNVNLGKTDRSAGAWRAMAGSVAAAFVWAACGGGSTLTSHLPSGPVNMGVLSCFTGSLASLGDAMLQGSQVAMQAINAGGGILGQQLTISHADTQCDEADGAVAVRQLLAANNVVGIIGPETQEINAVAPIVTSAKVPTQFQSGSTTFDKNSNHYLWRH